MNIDYAVLKSLLRMDNVDIVPVVNIGHEVDEGHILYISGGTRHTCECDKICEELKGVFQAHVPILFNIDSSISTDVVFPQSVAQLLHFNSSLNRLASMLYTQFNISNNVGSCVNFAISLLDDDYHSDLVASIYLSGSIGDRYDAINEFIQRNNLLQSRISEDEPLLWLSRKDRINIFNITKFINYGKLKNSRIDNVVYIDLAIHEERFNVFNVGTNLISFLEYFFEV